MEDIRIKRLEKLKETLILKDLSEINLDNSYELYDSLLYKTFSGDFNKEFLSTYLDDTNRDELLGLASKYSSLCFYLGEFDNWVDSIEGVSLSDLSLISTKVLDNYDYLIRLAKNGGEDVLKFLSKFQGNILSRRGAIIAVLRSSFSNDDILEKVLLEMSKEKGIYKDFSDDQKLVLCNYPLGVLYKVNEDKKVEITDPKLLKMSILKRFIGSLDFDVSEIDLSSFEDIISSIYTTYYEENNSYKK